MTRKTTPKRNPGGRVGQSMARRMVQRGAEGLWLDRQEKSASGRYGATRPLPASLIKFFKPIGGS